jgi:small subunit ribosomal protein S3
MGQKVSPIGFRTGITRGWMSVWYAPKASYGDFLVEDQKIRRFIDKKYNRQMPKGAVSRVEIVRTRNEVKVMLNSARPGIIIGPRGGEVEKLREELEALTGRKVTVNVTEIKEPDLDANLVAEAIAEQLIKRAAFKRAMKQYCEMVMNAGAKGVKIMCSGRLAGAEIARKEMMKMGSVPLHTLKADVDYSTATAVTTYGCIGIKVWIHKGAFGEILEPKPNRGMRRSGGGGGGGGGGRPTRRGPSHGHGHRAVEAPAAPAPQTDNAANAAPEQNEGTAETK